MGNLTILRWRAVIDGEEYGSDLDVSEENITREKLEEAINLAALQQKESLQKVLFGKTDSEIISDDAIRDFDQRSNL